MILGKWVLIVFLNYAHGHSVYFTSRDACMVARDGVRMHFSRFGNSLYSFAECFATGGGR